MDRSGRRHLLDELAWRGMIAHATDLGALRALMDAGPITFYCGFDPTAPSLQFGNLVQLVTLRRFQDAGHRIIGLVGGATGMVGDPSGKSEERRSTTRGGHRLGRPHPRRRSPGCCASKATTRRCWPTTWSGPDRCRCSPSCATWASTSRVSRMLAKEVVATRLEAGISYTEFSYQILQANDYLELYRRYGVRAADRRLGPVGQPHRRGGPDPAGRGRRGPRAGHAAHHEGGRHEVRQDAPARRCGSTRR